MDSGTLITVENTGPFSTLYEMGPDLMSEWMRSFLPYEARVRMMMLTRRTRAWMLKHCRMFCNDLDYGKLLRQRLYNFPLTARVACVSTAHISEQRYYGARDFMLAAMSIHLPDGDQWNSDYRTSMAFLSTEFSVFEAVLHPTSDYPFIDNVNACYGLVHPTFNTAPPVFFKFDPLHSSTRRHGVVSSTHTAPSKLPLSTLRGSTLDDTPFAEDTGRLLLDGGCLAPFDMTSPILVILNTSLAHTLALQGRSWMTYAAKMRSMRHDDDLEAQLMSSPDLAIRGTFAYTGRMTMENKKTKRVHAMIFLDYITRTMSDSVHRVG